ncbi:NADPH:quinone reductase [Virgisporangium aliadipatigenens]|uniref:NADPH:quinone reductase n=1 Tax=Virgisporangium aliadipatigenens TaxID=741659 RepID=A0A8J4DNE3_9ACTN|nr:NAD(P)-dependent alcohol dehydrogenase [Virgisporangium aliadipatigenens]GIJ44319.1 NADPH:quinone reductase [Virgisporangium aliadipatigenens]
MKAITQRVYGAPADVLTFGEVPTPVAKPGQVLIRVRAAGVDAGVWHAVRGEAYIARLYFGLPRPRQRVPGRDIAGTVEAVGEGVTRFAVGDAVWAEHDGAYAEYVAVPQQWVEPKPAGATFEQAAALSVSGKTALQAMRDAAQVGAGTRILINGASSGVGVYAVQVAKAFGAEVTGVCSGRNAALVRSLGADHVVDYTVEDFTTKKYDVIFDLIGNRSIVECRRALVPEGRLVLAFGGGGRWFGPVGKLLGAVATGRAKPFTAARKREDFVALRRMVEDGTLTPVIDRTFALPEAAAAIAYVESGRARGKVVLTN